MKKVISRIYMAIIFVFLYAPIVILVLFSFNDSDTKSRAVWSGFSLRWYQKLFSNGELLNALRNTLIIAVVAAIAATVLGTVAAIGINSMKKWPKRFVMSVGNLPMVNPEIVTGISLLLLFVFWRQTPACGIGYFFCYIGPHYLLSALRNSFRYA